MKIFIGLHNVGSLVETYARGFRALGHDVFTVINKRTSNIVSSCIDMDIESLVEEHVGNGPCPEEEKDLVRQHLRGIAWRKAMDADICFFVWDSFTNDGRDFEALKKMGKKIVVRICGSEVREPEIESQAARHDGMPSVTSYLASDPVSFEIRLRRLRMAEKHADMIIGFSPTSLRPTAPFLTFIYNPLKVVPRQEQRTHPVVLHAPSSSSTKGSKEIMEALDRLHDRDIQFGIKYINGFPYDDMPYEYASADIFCNSIYYSGNSIYEAMNAGCAVADYGIAHSKVMFRKYAAMTMRMLGFEGSAEDLVERWCDHNLVDASHDAPIVNIRPHTLEEKLSELIQDVDMRKDLVRRGREYMDRIFSLERTCQGILDYLADPESDESRMRLFVYPFFSRHFIPGPDPERLKIYNKYNALVRSCDWYRQFVRPGERNGLVF